MGGLCVGSDPTPSPKVRSEAADTGEVAHWGLILPAHGGSAPAAGFIAWGHHVEEPGFRRTQWGADSTRWLWVTSMLYILRTDQERGWPHLQPLPSKATGLEWH